MLTQDFLLEIGCEELPSHTQVTLSEALKNQFTHALTEKKLSFEKIKTFSTPRRLAIIVEGLQATQPPQLFERQGPSFQDAFDKASTPTLMGLGFAKSCGVSMDELTIKETPKGKKLVFVCEKQGNQTKEILPELVAKIISKLPLPKPMRWGAHTASFIRPVQWVVMLFGEELINAEILGVKTTRNTMGHRFHHDKHINITKPADYEHLLISYGFVIPDFEKRMEIIRKKLESLNNENQKVLIDKNLLKEVTGLVEWPVVLVGHFDQTFLSVPKEALMSTMQKNQKCFPVLDQKNNLIPQFILVSNIVSKDPQMVIKGNERVIHARLSDAAFFYHQDCKHTLSAHLLKLDHIVFQDQLGSIGDKTKRIVKLSSYIAKKIKANDDIVKRAALLSKCDLVTGMVSEFPDLQGVMGYYYALNDQESSACASALREYYYPKFSGDELPSTTEACCVALADRLDTLIGILGINKAPTGDKDPFALRRAAQGIVRILIEKSVDIDLVDLLDHTKKYFTQELPNKNVIKEAQDFMIARLKSWYIEKNITIEVFESVNACNITSLIDFDRRIKAVIKFQTLPEASSLAAANKRVSNILKKEKNTKYKSVNAALFEFDAEHHLANKIAEQKKVVDALYEKSDYEKALSELSVLKEPIDQFFESVMILVDDEQKKQNRLALLASIHHLFTKVADISLLP